MFNTLTNSFIKKQSNLFYRSIGVAFFFFASACTMDAKIENTAEPASSVNSPALPAAPTPLTLVTPSSSPGNNASPTIRVAGLANGDTVKLYSDVNCTIVISTVSATGSTYDFSLGPLTAGVYNYYATRATSAGTSSCSSSTVQYVLDLTAPSAPSGLALQSPASTPANDATPTITVSGVTSGDTIKLFTDSSCTTQVGSATASGTSVNVTSSTLTQGSYSFYANATDPAGNASTCSTATVAYVLDLTAPSAPSGLSLSNPTSSPGTEASPTIDVTGVVSGDAIKLFSDSSCTTQVASGTASATSISLTLSSALTLEGTYNYYANATDPVGNVSSCSTATVAYVYYFISYVTIDPNYQEVSEGNTSASFTVKMSPAKTYAVTLSYNLNNSTAVTGTHHDLTAGTVVIPANQTQASISFNLLENAAAAGTTLLQVSIYRTNRRETAIGNKNTGMPAVGRMYIGDNDYSAPAITEVANFSSIGSTKSDRWCVINASGVLKCWGSGPIGDGSAVARNSPTTISASGATFSKVVLDNCGGVTLGTDSKIRAWATGGSSSCSAGDGTTTARLTPVAVDSGTDFSQIFNNGYMSKCALTNLGKLKCWGDNFNSNLGDGTTTSRSSPVAIDASVDYSFISMGGQTSCGITTSGVLKCWGNNAYGALGDGTTTNRPSPVVIDSGTQYSKIATARVMAVSTCGITTAGVLKCWGYNANGEVGDGTNSMRVSPVVVDSGTSYTEVSVDDSGYFTCGLTTTNKIKCWGTHDLIDAAAATGTIRLPTLIDSSTDYTQLKITQNAGFAPGGICGVTSSNKIKCLGSGNEGALGIPTYNDQLSAVEVSNGISFTSVFLGSISSCGLTTSSRLVCWGRNENGELGLGWTSFKPTVIDDTDNYSKIIVGYNTEFYLLSSTGQMKSLWINPGGEHYAKDYPILLDGSNTFASMAVSASSKCGLTSAGALYCDSGAADFSTLDSGTNYSNIYSSSRADHFCGVTSAGVLKCWGWNVNGQLGDSTTSTRTTPVIIDSGTAYSSAVVGSLSTCGITTAGVLKCWGFNGNGAIGDNTTTNKLSPVIIDSGTTYQSVVKSTFERTCGITGAGALKCWGRNQYSSLGDGTTTNRYVPTLINSGTSYIKVFLNNLYHGCGITNANALKCWGYNYYYLGTTDTNIKTTPTLVNSGTSYANFSNFDDNWNGHQNCAITTTGVLKCWGQNYWGEVGDGYMNSLSAPAVIDSGTNYSEIATSEKYTCGITTGGVLKCWGGGRGPGFRPESTMPISRVLGLEGSGP